MGDKEKGIIKTSFAIGQPLPERIANAPVLRQGLSFYWWAFWEMATERPGGAWGIPPIPWSSINSFAQENDLDEETTHRLFFHVRGMDKTYREHHEKNLPNK